MQTEEFIKKVRVRGSLDDNEQSKDAIHAVFSTLRARISHEGGDNLAAQLPKELKDMWEKGIIEHLQRSVTGFERLDLGGFFARVADEVGFRDIQQSETVTRAVFITLQEQITPGAAIAVDKQLPNDIRDFWQSCAPKRATVEMAVETTEADVERKSLITTSPNLMSNTSTEETLATTPNFDIPTGYDVDMTVAQTEAQVRDMIGKARHVEPPSVERIQITPPVKARGNSGPGSEIYYRSDPEMTQEIEQMLYESAELESEDVDVFVQAGNVTLRGIVKSESVRDIAGKIAARALGVGEVRNELTIS